MKRSIIKEIYKTTPFETDAVVKGWIRSVRKSKHFSFIMINDGSCMESLQVIADKSLANYEEISTMLTGTSVSIEGKLVKSGGKQAIEMQANIVDIIGKSDETYPLQKKGTSLEFLREQAHLRVRSNTFGAVFRVRHHLSMATHSFFHERGFMNHHSPILTGVDAEGAGEMFNVTTMPLEEIKKNSKGEVDYQGDYFGKATNLCVTGQLEAETHALGLGAVYTFGPTFRSENSNTPRHLSEFWMIEPEVAFADLDDVAELAKDFIQYQIKWALEHCEEDIAFLAKMFKKDDQHIDKLRTLSTSEFKKITYTEAVEILESSKKKFEFPVSWGSELQTEHERYLAEEHFSVPVIVTDYPKEFKAFYMKQNDDGKTVRAMDVLVPGVGELIGGSQREDDLEKLTKRMDELEMNKDALWWYLDLRKFGSVPHAGFGMGFERMIMYVTGMANIRDVIPYPRTPKNLDF